MWDGCLESHFGVPAQSLSGGNTEAGTAHGLVTSVHKVSIENCNLGCKADMEGRRERTSLSKLTISKSGQ